MSSVPLGRFGSPFALLIVLPPLAVALEAYGVTSSLARGVARVGPRAVRLSATYALWLVTSALLTLDVAAAAASSAGIAIAGDDPRERRWQLGGAILGANVGSLLLPFSNLTNLMLVTASGLSFGAYVGVAVWPQVAAAAAVGLLLAARSHASETTAGPIAKSRSRPGPLPRTNGVGPTPRYAGAIAIGGAALAVGFGVTGRDVAVPFATSCALLCAIAVSTGRVTARHLLGTVPLAGLAVVAGTALVAGPLGIGAAVFPHPDGTIAGLVLALAVGGSLALVVNNLPAAAFGAVWLLHVGPGPIVAYLIGTNVTALATPHGSMATMLARVIARRHGVVSPVGEYLRSAWRYAAVGTLSGIAALAAVVH